MMKYFRKRETVLLPRLHLNIIPIHTFVMFSDCNSPVPDLSLLPFFDCHPIRRLVVIHQPHSTLYVINFWVLNFYCLS